MAKTEQNENTVICNLKALRQAKGWSQSQIAEMIGVKRQAVYDMETGRYMPNTGVALRLAKCLGCRVEDIFSEISDTEEKSVTLISSPARTNARVSLVKIRERLIGYPLNGRDSLMSGFHAADGLVGSSGKKVKLLEDENRLERTALVLGCDPSFAVLSSHVSRTVADVRLMCRFESSYSAMKHLAAGHAHLAGTHLHNTDDSESNAVAAKKILGKTQAFVIGFSLFEEGMMVAPGNPFNIQTVADLAERNIRIVNREPGAALRILLDDVLNKSGIPGSAVNGYSREVFNHAQGAAAVLYGAADAAMGLGAIAAAYGLDFIPIKAVRCDLIIPKDMMSHPAVSITLDVLQTRRFHKDLMSLPGYESSCTGKIISEL